MQSHVLGDASKKFSWLGKTRDEEVAIAKIVWISHAAAIIPDLFTASCARHNMSVLGCMWYKETNASMRIILWEI